MMIDYQEVGASIIQSQYNHSVQEIQVTTSDDYILTLFKVWNEEKRDPQKGPVMF